ncbi:hypothetical protein QTO34_001330 [Cnephaeus nilssonii]|uniref:Uncharacterized protein n=1 Tax=Cnephaeus nilssonii TaxID=3371016 RepID=A0AA40HVH5_CNENI|nr:hypothetical protein QTO34_001330 [Eptesicus nilssonii]
METRQRMESSDEEDMEKHRIHLRPVALRTRCTSCPVKSGLTGPPLWGAFSPRPSVRVPMDSKGRSLRGEEVEVPPGLLGYMMGAGLLPPVPLNGQIRAAEGVQPLRLSTAGETPSAAADHQKWGSELWPQSASHGNPAEDGEQRRGRHGEAPHPPTPRRSAHTLHLLPCEVRVNGPPLWGAFSPRPSSGSRWTRSVVGRGGGGAAWPAGIRDGDGREVGGEAGLFSGIHKEEQELVEPPEALEWDFDRFIRASASFSRFTRWGLESIPGPDAKVRAALTWPSLAEAIHKQVPQD